VVSCEVPLGSSVMWLTPLSVWVAVPGAPEHGFTSGALSVPLKWTVVVWAWAKAAIGLSRATSNPATATPATIRTRMGLPPSRQPGCRWTLSEDHPPMTTADGVHRTSVANASMQPQGAALELLHPAPSASWGRR
jgi:hypothetical protein